MCSLAFGLHCLDLRSAPSVAVEVRYSSFPPGAKRPLPLRLKNVDRDIVPVSDLLPAGKEMRQGGNWIDHAPPLKMSERDEL